MTKGLIKTYTINTKGPEPSSVSHNEIKSNMIFKNQWGGWTYIFIDASDAIKAEKLLASKGCTFMKFGKEYNLPIGDK